MKLKAINGVLNGMLASLIVPTAGVETQDQILDDLIRKYGQPTTLTRQGTQNRMGARFDRIVASWRLGDLRIEFGGFSTDMDRGELVIGTPQGVDAFYRLLNESHGGGGRKQL